jgi:hypothetical protein
MSKAVFVVIFRRRRLGAFERIRDAVAVLSEARTAAGRPHEGHLKVERSSP